MSPTLQHDWQADWDRSKESWAVDVGNLRYVDIFGDWLFEPFDSRPLSEQDRPDCDICGARWWYATSGNSAGQSHAGWCRRERERRAEVERAALRDLNRRVLRRTQSRWVAR